MDQQPPPADEPGRARSFDRVAEAYDRARPSYPDAAVAWLVGASCSQVLELGAGTGKLTEVLTRLGHRVVASDPSEQMVRRLVERSTPAHPVLSAAEALGLADGCADAVVVGQAYHWFDARRALPEAARVLRPGGVFAALWNVRDERVPWVRRLGRLVGTPAQVDDPTPDLAASGLFDEAEHETFRLWQPLDRDALRDLVRSRSNIAVMAERERARVLTDVDELYDEYGRGADGMVLPYLTHAYRARLAAPAPGQQPPASRAPRAPRGEGSREPGPLDTDSLLIDFR